MSSTELFHCYMYLSSIVCDFVCSKVDDLLIYCSAGQCPVSVPTIVSSSSSDDICRVVSQETLTYTCNHAGSTIVWSSSVFDANYAVVVGVQLSIPSSTVSGVTFTENNNNNAACLNSTLNFSGNLTSLTALNGVTLNCTSGGVTPSSVTIMVPGKWVILCSTYIRISWITQPLIVVCIHVQQGYAFDCVSLCIMGSQ